MRVEISEDIQLRGSELLSHRIYNEQLPFLQHSYPVSYNCPCTESMSSNITHNPEEFAAKAFDIVIVGGGTAGLTLATR